MAIRIDDLPEQYQRQARAQLNRPAPVQPIEAIPRTQPSTTHRCPNKTEAAYRDRHLAGQDARYEALTFRLANTHRYTPDWVVVRDGCVVECHEVKGAYRLHSHGRARLAFDQARVEWPGIKWVWAEGET